MQDETLSTRRKAYVPGVVRGVDIVHSQSATSISASSQSATSIFTFHSDDVINGIMYANVCHSLGWGQ